MKANHSPKAAMVPLVAALFFTTSCVYNVPLDHFCKTAWTTSENPLSGLTLSFLNYGQIAAQISSEAEGSLENNMGQLDLESEESFGMYEVYDMTAYFVSLQISYAGYTVVIEEAHRTDDLLLITWHIAESFYGTGAGPEGFDTPGISFSTRLYRITE